MGDLHGLARSPRKELRMRAAVTSALLSAMFLVVYGTTNWLTSQRGDVPTWHASWELAIPFMPLLILPYMSIDLFFVTAPFVCGSRREMNVLVKRLVFANLVAAAFFVLMPFQLGFERATVGGWQGLVFDTFREMDLPYNLFPSLHIAQLGVLAAVYGGHTRGVLWVACQAWFGLIIASTVLTHQHHLIDIAGGVLLGAFACQLFRESPAYLPVQRNVRLGAYYAAGAIALVIPAALLGPWGAFLVWPAAALGLVAAGYFGLGPAVFRKENGRLPISTRIALAPVLIGQYLSLLYYRRQCRPWDTVVPGVLIGRALNSAEAAEAVREGVTAVLDLTGELSEAAPFLERTYRNIQVLDLTAPTPEQLREAVAFITAEAECGTVYVHCKIGYSRSAAVIGAYLLASGQAMTADEAVALLRRARPSIVIRAEALTAIRGWAPHAEKMAGVQGRVA